jgi:uncharacterized protein YchJ
VRRWHRGSGYGIIVAFFRNYKEARLTEMGFLDRVASYFSSGDDSVQMAKPGRNELCWCGSGQKYKRCCLGEDERKARRFAPKCGTT